MFWRTWRNWRSWQRDPAREIMLRKLGEQIVLYREEEALVDQLLLDHVDFLEKLRKLFPDPEEARTWLFSPHALLAGDSPAQRISQGYLEDVEALLDQLETGNYLWHES